MNACMCFVEPLNTHGIIRDIIVVNQAIRNSETKEEEERALQLGSEGNEVNLKI